LRYKLLVLGFWRSHPPRREYLRRSFFRRSDGPNVQEAMCFLPPCWAFVFVDGAYVCMRKLPQADALDDETFERQSTPMTPKESVDMYMYMSIQFIHLITNIHNI
jgi:hypothetical protein